MSVCFDDEAIRKADAVGYLKGAAEARQYILEDKYALLRGLVGDFVGLFGKNPQADEAAQFLEILRDELDAVKSDLGELYGRDID